MLELYSGKTSNKYAICLAVYALFIVSGCASSSNSLYRQLSENKNSIILASLQKKKQQIEEADQSAQEAETQIKSQLVDKDTYITSMPLCTILDINYTKNHINRQKHLDFAETLDLSARDQYYKDNGVESSAPPLPEKVTSFNSLSLIKIIDIKVQIPLADKSSFDFSNRAKETSYSGSADIYFTVSQGPKEFVVHSKIFNLDRLLKHDIRQSFFDSSDNKEWLSCFSQNNLVKKYRLSKKEIDSISRNNFYIGMRKDAFILAVGSPNKINSTTTRMGRQQQWIYNKYRNSYFYFNEKNLLTSWQEF